MNNPFVEEIRNPTLQSVSGCEALTFVERLGTYVGEFSLGIDKRFASFNSSIHKIDYTRARIKANSLNYFKVEQEAIPVSEMFDPSKMTWEHYVNYVLNGIPLVTNLKDETGRMYDWIKSVAATGKVGRSFRYSLSVMDELVSSCEDFVTKGLTPNNHRQARIRDIYPSWNSMFQLVDRYNKNVNTLKGRDIEIISKQLDQIKHMGDLIVKKIKANDIVVTEIDMNELADSFDYFNRAVNAAGAMAGLINELRDTLAGQCEAVLNLKN